MSYLMFLSNVECMPTSNNRLAISWLSVKVFQFCRRLMKAYSSSSLNHNFDRFQNTRLHLLNIYANNICTLCPPLLRERSVFVNLYWCIKIVWCFCYCPRSLPVSAIRQGQVYCYHQAGRGGVFVIYTN